jgi:threonine dehydrogenase-like Zn-dependent dehydrogenase
MTEGRGADAIVEVTGNPKAVAQALDLATPGTTLVLTGVSGDGKLQFDSNDVVLRELTIRGAVASRGHFSRAMKLVATHGGPIETLVSRVLRWTDAGAAIRTVHTNRSIGKVLLEH